MWLEYTLGYKTIIKECPANEIGKFIMSPLTGEVFLESYPKGLFKITKRRENRFILEEYRKNKKNS